MFEAEDLEPRRAKPKPRDLQGLSVEELENYIAELESEIARAEAAIAQKQAHKSATEALFGKKPG